jgi:hypothetical protein
MKTLKQSLSILLTPLLVASVAAIAAGVVGLVVIAGWQDKLEK